MSKENADRPAVSIDQEITAVLNRYSAENASDTPDFILAQYLLGCLAAWNQAVQAREAWYGREVRLIGGYGRSAGGQDV